MKDFQSLLFLCTGNFYRSRFAEAYFNHLVDEKDIAWRATSRGFRPHLATEDLSHLAVERLEKISVSINGTGPKPLKLKESDLAEASLVITLYEPEHRPMLVQQFPHWENRVRYWQVPDIDLEPSSVALPKIEAEVAELVQHLDARSRT